MAKPPGNQNPIHGYLHPRLKYSLACAQWDFRAPDFTVNVQPHRGLVKPPHRQPPQAGPPNRCPWFIKLANRSETVEKGFRSGDHGGRAIPGMVRTLRLAASGSSGTLTTPTGTTTDTRRSDEFRSKGQMPRKSKKINGPGGGGRTHTVLSTTGF